MRITNFETFEVPPRWVFLKLETADGLAGWGEISLSRQRRAAQGAVTDFMEEFILEASANRIEDHWQRMFRHGRFRGGPVLMTAISGIDMALWDIKGQTHGLPVYEFLGGAVRDSVRLYQHVGGETPEAVAADAQAAVDDGFTALKRSIHGPLRKVDRPHVIEHERAIMKAVREQVGSGIDIGLDFHGRASKAMAKQLAVELEAFRPMFYEEAVPGPEHADNYPELANHTTIPIATGERRHSRWAFKDLLENGSVDILQPDLCYAGGISECRRIAAMAEAYDVALAPHCPFGPISLAACLQLDACTPNAIIQEQIVHGGERQGVDPLDYVNTPEVFAYDDGGYVDLPSGSGLGIEVDEATVRAMTAGEGAWESAQWRADDGTIAEW